MVLTTDIQECSEAFLQTCQFSGIFLIGIFYVLKCSGRVDIVSGIYPHFLCIKGCNVGNVGIEVHVGNERCHIAFGTQLCIDVCKVLCLTHTLGCQPHIFASCVDNALCLCHRALRVGG